MPEHFYVYPAYLDRKLTRADGRRVPEPDGTPDVTTEEIAQAAKRLGWKAETEAAKHYPRRFFAYGGRVKVVKRAGAPKAKALRILAEEVRKVRGLAGKS
ncbi:MAG: signal recognition particle subunit SRP19/SEC65 family protein [Thermoplasmata archaeon]